VDTFDWSMVRVFMFPFLLAAPLPMRPALL
jgi:hypothetical protein